MQTARLQRGKNHNECPGYDTKRSGEVPGDWGNVEYPFIVIAPKSTLARNGST